MARTSSALFMRLRPGSFSPPAMFRSSGTVRASSDVFGLPVGYDPIPNTTGVGYHRGAWIVSIPETINRRLWGGAA